MFLFGDLGRLFIGFEILKWFGCGILVGGEVRLRRLFILMWFIGVEFVMLVFLFIDSFCCCCFMFFLILEDVLVCMGIVIGIFISLFYM